MLQRRAFINNIRMLQLTRMLQRTRKNTIDRRSTRVYLKCWDFQLRLERQSSSLLSFVRFISVMCLFVSLAGKDSSCFIKNFYTDTTVIQEKLILSLFDFFTPFQLWIRVALCDIILNCFLDNGPFWNETYTNIQCAIVT